MDEDSAFYQAKKEMVRVDHLIFVSLKYSRTVDVIKSVIKRLISTIDITMQACLEVKYSGDGYKEVMHGSKTMRDAMCTDFPETAEFMEFYKFLRELDKAAVKARLNEFRRHVTLVADVDGKEYNIKIETVQEYYERTKEYLNKIEAIVRNGEKK
jgi:hypothetical protein